MTDAPRIYVASLSDYNAGTLHGRWINADQDAAEIQAEVNEMLARSPEARLCQFCGGPIAKHRSAPSTDPDASRTERCGTPLPGNAEEWAIHDYEGFGGIHLSEYESFERVAKLGQAIAEAGEDAGALTAWLGLDDDNDPENFGDHYRGRWESVKDYVETDEIGEIICGLMSLRSVGTRFMTEREQQSHKDAIETVASFIDWDMVERTLVTGGGYTIVDAGSPDYGVYIFEDEV